MLARTRRSLVALALLFAPTSFVATVLREAPAFADEAYKLHMENGIKLFQEKNYGAALAEFRAAYDAKPKASPLLNMALCYKAEFNYPKAIQVLEKAIKEHGDTLDPADTRASEDAIREMRGLLAFVTLRITPSQATLSIDGEDQPPNTQAAPIPLGPGKHRLGAHIEGYESSEIELTAVSGQRVSKEITLVPNKGWLMIDYRGMAFALDGTYIGHDRFGGPVAPGSRVLQIYAPTTPEKRANTPQSYSVPLQVVVGQTIAITQGANGVPYMSGRPVGTASTNSPRGAPLPPLPAGRAPRPAEPEPPPEPQKRGFYGLAGATLLWPTGTASSVTPNATQTDPNPMAVGFSKNSGFGVDAEAGYRVNNVAGFELYFEYMNLFTPVADSADYPNQGYTETSVRIGPGLRLMTPGKTFRFVGTLVGGFAYDGITYSSALVPDSTTTHSAAAFALLETGLEVDLGGVLIDGVLEGVVQTTRSLDASSMTTSNNGNQPIGFGGLGLRVGYAFWH